MAWKDASKAAACSAASASEGPARAPSTGARRRFKSEALARLSASCSRRRVRTGAPKTSSAPADAAFAAAACRPATCATSPIPRLASTRPRSSAAHACLSRTESAKGSAIVPAVASKELGRRPDSDENPYTSMTFPSWPAKSRFHERLAKNILFFNFARTRARLLPRDGRRLRRAGDDTTARRRLSIEGRERDEGGARAPAGSEGRARRSSSVGRRFGEADHPGNAPTRGPREWSGNRVGAAEASARAPAWNRKRDCPA